METNQIIVLAVLAYGVFIGYCLGRAQGYYAGANVARDIYRTKIKNNPTLL
jgi:ABC-type dipeptide/oligopeptide/nickel transport system permease subunit